MARSLRPIYPQHWLSAHDRNLNIRTIFQFVNFFTFQPFLSSLLCIREYCTVCLLYSKSWATVFFFFLVALINPSLYEPLTLCHFPMGSMKSDVERSTGAVFLSCPFLLVWLLHFCRLSLFLVPLSSPLMTSCMLALIIGIFCFVLFFYHINIRISYIHWETKHLNVFAPIINCNGWLNNQTNRKSIWHMNVVVRHWKPMD